MSTISVPLAPKLEQSLEDLVKSGYGSNKADVVRRAITKAVEDEAVAVVLRAMEETSLKGNLRDLAKKLK